MRSVNEIRRLLAELDNKPADAMEDQDLDFKEWNVRSMADAVAALVEMAVCMANGGGGTVVFGVRDQVVGRGQAIPGVPPEVDVNRLKKTVYDLTDPKITPVFEELHVPEGTGRVLIMQVYPGLPPYTDTAGRGKVRIGKDCQPLTGTLRQRILVETGESDYSAVEVPEAPQQWLSSAALEQLREVARLEKAPHELLQQSDLDLLGTLGVIRDGHLTRAGVLLAGTETAIRRHIPAYVWTHLRMKNDTEYSGRLDGHEALPVALGRMLDQIMADNQITTVQHGLFHFEYRTYPEIALREALLNAFCHADYRLAGPILVKQFSNRIEINNPGGFIGGISPSNILHHTPIARNPLLVEALTRLRLVNRSNLGMARMFSALLIEGKEPPIIEQQGEAVKVIFVAAELSASFRAFVAEEDQQGRSLSVDHLLILRRVLRQAEIDTASAAQICQRSEAEARDILSEMEVARGYLERGGSGRGTFWTLRPEIHQRLAPPGYPERHRRIDWETAKTRVLSILKQHAAQGAEGLSNAEIRQITRMNRHQVRRLMDELRTEEPKISLSGRGKLSRYRL